MADITKEAALEFVVEVADALNSMGAMVSAGRSLNETLSNSSAALHNYGVELRKGPLESQEALGDAFDITGEQLKDASALFKVYLTNLKKAEITEDGVIVNNKELASSFDAVKNQLETSGVSLVKIRQLFGDVTRDIIKTRDEQVRQKGTTEKQRQAFSFLTDELKKVSGGMKFAGKAANKATKELSEVTKKPITNWGKFTAAVQKSRTAVGKFGTGVRGVGAALTALTAGLGVRKLVSWTAAAVESGRELQRMQRALFAVTGNTKAAGEEFEFVRNLAVKLGVDLGTTGKEYSKLAAAAKASGVAQEDVHDIFAAVSEASITLGLSNAQLEDTFVALQQIISKGKVQTEELRRQIGDRLPGAFAIAAKAMNVTTGRLDEMLEQGKITAQEFLRPFAREIRNEFGKGLPQAIQSTEAAIGRFQTTFFELKASFAAGFFDVFKQELNLLSEDLEKNKEKAEEWGKFYGAFLQTKLSSLRAKLHLARAGFNMMTGDVVDTGEALDKFVESQTIAIGRSGQMRNMLLGNAEAAAEYAEAAKWAAVALKELTGDTSTITEATWQKILAMENAKGLLKDLQDRYHETALAQQKMAEMELALAENEKLRHEQIERGEEPEEALIDRIERTQKAMGEGTTKLRAFIKIQKEDAAAKAEAERQARKLEIALRDLRKELGLNEEDLEFQAEALEQVALEYEELAAAGKLTQNQLEQLRLEGGKILDKFRKMGEEIPESLLEVANRMGIFGEEAAKAGVEVRKAVDEWKNYVMAAGEGGDVTDVEAEKIVSGAEKIKKSIMELTPEMQHLFFDDEKMLETFGDMFEGMTSRVQEKLEGLKEEFLDFQNDLLEAFAPDDTDAEALKGEVAKLGEELEGLKSKTHQTQDDLNRIAEVEGELAEKQIALGRATSDLSDDFKAWGEQTSLSADLVDEKITGLIENNEDFTNAFANLDEQSKESIQRMLTNLRGLADQGVADSGTVQQTFKDMGDVFANNGIEIDELRDSLDAFGGHIDPVERSIERLGTVQDKSVEQTKRMNAEMTALTEGLRDIPDAAKQMSDHTLMQLARLGAKLSELTDKVTGLNNALNEVGGSSPVGAATRQPTGIPPITNDNISSPAFGGGGDVMGPG